jgi:hypothetical protein
MVDQDFFLGSSKERTQVKKRDNKILIPGPNRIIDIAMLILNLVKQEKKSSAFFMPGRLFSTLT